MEDIAQANNNSSNQSLGVQTLITEVSMQTQAREQFVLDGTGKFRPISGFNLLFNYRLKKLRPDQFDRSQIFVTDVCWFIYH